LRELVLATRNPHKLEEAGAILSGADIVVRGLGEFGDIPEVVEDRDTFDGNAAKKAEEVSRATGLPALADDSGLVVDALGGAPGVLSARYAGSDGDDKAKNSANNAKLLSEMEAVADADRDARFVCVIALAREGRGFGYDPLFISDDLRVTFAEAGPDRKNAVSHRGRALAAFADALAAGELDEFFD